MRGVLCALCCVCVYLSLTSSQVGGGGGGGGGGGVQTCVNCDVCGCMQDVDVCMFVAARVCVVGTHECVDVCIIWMMHVCYCVCVDDACVLLCVCG